MSPNAGDGAPPDRAPLPQGMARAWQEQSHPRVVLPPAGPSLGPGTDILGFVLGLPRRILAQRTPFARFLCSALTPTPTGYQPGDCGLFPMPPPYSWRIGPRPQSAAGRMAWRLNAATRILTNLIIVSLSHFACSAARRCPPRARTGGALSPPQASAAAWLRTLAAQMIDPIAPRSDRLFRSQLLLERSLSLSSLSLGSCSPPPQAAIGQIDPSRATFAKTLADFDPRPHMSVFAAACYEEPRLLEGRLPPRDAAPAPPQRGRTADVLSFLTQWDCHGRLLLEPSGATERTQQGSLFPVPKSATEDRIVFNRIPRNKHEQHLAGYAKFTPAGSDFVDIEAPADAECLLYADDLADAFPSFRASRERGSTNALAWTAPTAAFEGTLALKELRRHCVARGRELPSRVRPCHKGLMMGDVNAADFCAEAHTKVLRRYGSLPVERSVANGRPFPRGPVYEALVLDDHVGIGVGSAVAGGICPELEQSFAAARSGYEAVGLQAHDRKARRGERGGVVLGAEFLSACALAPAPPLQQQRKEQQPQQFLTAALPMDASSSSPALSRRARRRAARARAHWVGSERSRRCLLMAAVVETALAAQGTRRHLRQLASSLTHAFLFRRPLLCCLSKIYEFMGQVGPEEDTVVSLPTSVVDELLAAGLWLGIASSNLSAVFHDTLLATDASTFGEGVAEAKLPTAVARELWRHRDRRGGYTRLHPGIASHVMEAAGGDLAAGDDDLPLGSLPSPERVLIETFDFIEICSGSRAPLSAAMAKAGFRVGPRIDLKVNDLWDLTSSRIVQWLLFMVEHKRVWGVHDGVPCTDFSLAHTTPIVRSRRQPWGFAPKDPGRRIPNFLLAVACLLLMAKLRSGFGWMSHEHPATAHSWSIAFWRWFLLQCDCNIFCYAACRFGALYRKLTRLAVVRASFLKPLMRPCICTTKHKVTLTGGRAAAAAEYLPAFCQEFAALALEHFRAEPPQYAEEDLELVTRQRELRSERLWLNELVEGLTWRTTVSTRSPRVEHINIKETRRALQAACDVGLATPGRKVILLPDSRVAIGAIAKGRSASHQLNLLLRSAVGNIVGADLYLGCLFSPTRLQPADDGSRLKAAPGRVQEGTGLPHWAELLVQGRFDEFDSVAEVPLQSARTAPWARIVLRCAALGLLRLSPKQLPWDPTLGYPGEGPPRAAPADRSADLVTSRATNARVRERRRLLLNEFAAFISLSFAGLPLADFLEYPATRVDRALAEWGQIWFRAGRSHLDFCELVNAVVDQQRALRGHLSHSWDVAWMWRALLPGGNRCAMPESVFLAMVSLALQWNWPHIALLLATGFCGMLRVHELRDLTFGDYLTPSALLRGGCTVYVTIGRPKMRRIAARRGYARLDEPGLADFVEAMTHAYASEDLVFPGTYAQLRQAMLAMCAELGLPSESRRGGLSWGSLRAGGATWLFQATDSPELVRYRGRWSSGRMLEIYIQEVGSSSILPALPAQTRERVRELAAWAPTLMQQAAQRLVASARVDAPSAQGGT